VKRTWQHSSLKSPHSPLVPFTSKHSKVDERTSEFEWFIHKMMNRDMHFGSVKIELWLFWEKVTLRMRKKLLLLLFLKLASHKLQSTDLHWNYMCLFVYSRTMDRILYSILRLFITNPSSNGSCNLLLL
jgi:hypothetical protein